MSYDIDKILSDNPIESVIKNHITLKQAGDRFDGLCCFHNEHTPSFCVYTKTQSFYCFGCGENGDLFDFVMKFNGVSFKEACAILGGEKQAPDHKDFKKRAKQVFKSAYDGITPVYPIPSEATLIPAKKRTPEIWNPTREKFSTYTPSMVFEYKNIDGYLMGYVLRIDFEDGNKITPAIMWCKWEDTQGWCHYTFPQPRWLYGLDGLKRDPDAPVLITEGEKAADAAHKLFPRYVVLTWAGGTQAVAMSDWSVLSGRKVLIWPDADEPGIEAAHKVAAKCLDAQAIEVKIIDWDKEKPKGWDAFDALEEKWTKDKVIEWARPRIITWPVKKEEAQPEVHQEAPPMSAYEDEAPEFNEKADLPVQDNKPPFRILGHLNGWYYYLPSGTQQIISYTPAQHTLNNLISIAPIAWWENHFPKKGGIDCATAWSVLQGQSTVAGYFDINQKTRGRGAWLDAGRTVIHTGEIIYSEGKEYQPYQFESKYVYEGRPGLEFRKVDEAKTAEAQTLIKICNSLTWENPLSGTLLAGWLIIAPVCGILKWRPHIWICGAKSAGKSWCVDNLVIPMLGNFKVKLDSKSTEAAIRQNLKHDGLPVILDEIEAESKIDMMRLQGILDFARVSSSGGVIGKGTSDGRGMNFTAKSCFMFSSINVNILHSADESRITKLVLKKDERPDADDKFKTLDNLTSSTVTADYPAKILARSINNLAVLRKNCDTFVEAVAKVLKSRRIADQIGNLLAGAYLCHSLKEISLADAVAFVNKHDWSYHTIIHSKKDEEKLMDRIMTHRVKLNTGNGIKDASIGELIIICNNGFSDNGVNVDEATRELRLHGLSVEEGSLYISNSSDPLKKILTDTPWGNDWGRPLRDLYNAELTTMKYFAPGIKARATKIPVGLITE